LKLGGKKEKRKLIAFVLMFLLVTPLTIFYILDGRGVFDTRGRAAFDWEACEYSKADLSKDGIVDMVDFGLWLRHYRDFKENPSDFSAIADLTDSGEIGMSDFAVWLRLWRQYKACQEGLSKGDTSKCLSGCFPTTELPNDPWEPPDDPREPPDDPVVTSPHCSYCSANYQYVKANFDIKGYSSLSYPTEEYCKKVASGEVVDGKEDPLITKLYYTCAANQCTEPTGYPENFDWADPNDTYPGYTKTGPWAPYKGILTEAQYEACYESTPWQPPPDGDCACDPEELAAVSCPLIEYNGEEISGHEYYKETGAILLDAPYYEGGCPEGSQVNESAAPQANPDIPDGTWHPACVQYVEGVKENGICQDDDNGVLSGIEGIAGSEFYYPFRCYYCK
jgi:hypothetical protein